jgi:hypothetical protein
MVVKIKSEIKNESKSKSKSKSKSESKVKSDNESKSESKVKSKDELINNLLKQYIKIIKEKKSENKSKSKSKSKSNIPCVKEDVDYRIFKNFITKLREMGNKNKEINKSKIDKISLCKVNAYNKYLKAVSPEGLFFNLRNYHKNIKSNYIHKYGENCDLLIDVGSSQLKSMSFWKSAKIKKVIAMEPSKELFNLGMRHLRKDFYGKSHVTFLQAVGEESWKSGKGGLNPFAVSYLENMIKDGIKANVITFEFTFHYMIYNMKVLIENIKSICKSGTKVIIHCINGDFLMDVFNKETKYEVLKDNDVVFYAQKKFKSNLNTNSNTNSNTNTNTNLKSLSKSAVLKLKEVDIYFRGAQGLNNVISEYLVIKDDIVSVFNKNGFELIEFLPFSQQNYKDFNLEEYEFNVSKIYTTYVFNYL